MIFKTILAMILRGVVATMLDSNGVGREFELQWRYYDQNKNI